MIVDLTLVERALQDEQIVPCFQPLVELRSGRLVGFELLARWPHPQLGLILPENFIQVVEDHGLAGRLMQIVLEKAFRSVAHIVDQRGEPLTLAVNISPLQLRDLALPNQICEAAQETGFDLQHLVIEITESALVNNLDQARQITHRLKDLGCCLALDDFGMGYSNFAQLQRLSFDQLKIAGSFIRRMTTSRESRKIVAAVIGLGQSLGLTTLAEEIETEEQADMLLWLGCERGQGWLYSRAVEAARIPAVLAAFPHKTPQRLPSFGQQQTGQQSMGSGLESLPAQRLAQLQAIYHGAPVGLCFLDRNFRHISVNQCLADMNGLPISAHIGRTVEEVVPGTIENIRSYLLRALQGEAVSNVTVAQPPLEPGGLPRSSLISYQPAFDEAGEVVGISVAVVDITDRKRAEEALRERETQYRDIIELSPQVPWIMNPDGNIVDVSTKWVDNSGLSFDRSMGNGWLAALHPDDLEPVLKTLGRCLRTGEPIDVEYRIRANGADWRWMRSRGSARRDLAGNIIRWYGVLEDIDDRKQLEAELRRSQALLQSLFREVAP
jgi:PAS domain S-box-containing protein